MKKHLDLIVTFLAVATTVAVFLSLCHESGYFSVIGKQLLGTVSFFDYVSRTIEWLPYTASGVLPGIIAGYLQEIDPSTSANRHAALIRHCARAVNIVAIAGFAIIFTGIHFEMGQCFANVAWLMPVLSGWLWGTLMGVVVQDFNKDKVGDLAAILLVVSVVAIITTAGALNELGRLNATRDLAAPTRLAMLKTADETSEQQVQILRVLERGLIIHRPVEKRNEFIPWGAVRYLIP